MECTLSILPLLKLVPFGHDVIKMFEDDAPDGSFVRRTHVIGVGLDGLEPLNIEPAAGGRASVLAGKTIRCSRVMADAKRPHHPLIRLVGLLRPWNSNDYRDFPAVPGTCQGVPRTAVADRRWSAFFREYMR